MRWYVVLAGCQRFIGITGIGDRAVILLGVPVATSSVEWNSSPPPETGSGVRIKPVTQPRCSRSRASSASRRVLPELPTPVTRASRRSAPARAQSRSRSSSVSRPVKGTIPGRVEGGPGPGPQRRRGRPRPARARGSAPSPSQGHGLDRGQGTEPAEDLLHAGVEHHPHRHQVDAVARPALQDLPDEATSRSPSATIPAPDVPGQPSGRAGTAPSTWSARMRASRPVRGSIVAHEVLGVPDRGTRRHIPSLPPVLGDGEPGGIGRGRRPGPRSARGCRPGCMEPRHRQKQVAAMVPTIPQDPLHVLPPVAPVPRLEPGEVPEVVCGRLHPPVIDQVPRHDVPVSAPGFGCHTLAHTGVVQKHRGGSLGGGLQGYAQCAVPGVSGERGQGGSRA